jgi:hypothetical protein
MPRMKSSRTVNALIVAVAMLTAAGAAAPQTSPTLHAHSLTPYLEELAR